MLRNGAGTMKGVRPSSLAFSSPNAALHDLAERVIAPERHLGSGLLSCQLQCRHSKEDEHQAAWERAYRRQCCRYAASCAATNSTTLFQSQDGASSDFDRLRRSSAIHCFRRFASICRAWPRPTTRARNSATSIASLRERCSISIFRSCGRSSRTTLIVLADCPPSSARPTS
jgi:hypothetical protein